MRIRYEGPHKEVEIAATRQTCERGQIIDVAADVARELVKQDSWSKAPAKKKTTKE